MVLRQKKEKDWKNPDTIKVWISSFNQTYPNDIINEQELSDQVLILKNILNL